MGVWGRGRVTLLWPTHPAVARTASPPPAPTAPDLLFLALVAGTALLVLVALWRFDVIRPGSFRRAPRRQLDALPWWGWIAAALAMFGATMLGGLVGSGVATAAGMKLAGEDTPTSTTVVVQATAYAVAISAGILLIMAIRRADPAAQTGTRLGALDAFYGLAWFVLVAPIVWLSTFASVALAGWLGDKPDSIAHVTLERIRESRSDPWVWGTIAIVVVGAPIVEELVYRVFVQTGLVALLGRPWIAIALTSVFFASMHVSAVPWYALPSLCVFGFTLGLAYERSRRLGVPITMHALFNLANIGLVLAGQAGGASAGVHLPLDFGPL